MSCEYVNGIVRLCVVIQEFISLSITLYTEVLDVEQYFYSTRCTRGHMTLASAADNSIVVVY